MGPAGKWDSFQVNVPTSITGGAVIAAIICNVSLELSVLKEK
jgi:hypothetical protein